MFAAIHRQCTNSNDGQGLPTYSVLKKEDFVIVQDVTDDGVPIHTGNSESIRILHALQREDTTEIISGADTEGSVSDSASSVVDNTKIPLKRSKRIRKTRNTPY